ncbi:MAG: type II toxin-antitoxin system HicA family toxin [Blastochloris sp.]|nr:type II toxin-antitoxin system HicA family toxin [Blastochloris sp.]
MKIPRDSSGQDLVKALRVLEYERVRQDGSHIRLTTLLDGEFHVTVPNHKPLKVGTFKNILKLVAEHHRLTLPELLEKLDL